MASTFDQFISQCDRITKKIELLGVATGKPVVVDGVIDPERYHTVSPRIMWLLKEADSKESWSYQESFRSTTWLGRCNGMSSIRRVIYTSYGILKGVDRQWGEYPSSGDDICRDSLRDIAFVNIKKIPGGSAASDRRIAEAYTENRELLKMQFEAYDPQVVIFGNTMKYVYTEDFQGLAQAEKQISGLGNHYYCAGDKLYINTWHPAYLDLTDRQYVMDIVAIYRNWKKLTGK